MKTVTVRQGDTLSQIALREWGRVDLWPQLYAWNVDSIEASQQPAERQRRHMSGPDWIFPGTVLRLEPPPEDDGLVE